MYPHIHWGGSEQPFLKSCSANCLKIKTLKPSWTQRAAKRRYKIWICSEHLYAHPSSQPPSHPVWAQR